MYPLDTLISKTRIFFCHHIYSAPNAIRLTWTAFEQKSGLLHPPARTMSTEQYGSAVTVSFYLLLRVTLQGLPGCFFLTRLTDSEKYFMHFWTTFLDWDFLYCYSVSKHRLAFTMFLPCVKYAVVTKTSCSMAHCILLVVLIKKWFANICVRTYIQRCIMDDII